jgi:sensor histidine kinase YesM
MKQKIWFEHRKWIYLTFLIVQCCVFIITGDKYPTQSYLTYVVLHHLLCVPMLYVFSFYLIRLFLFKQKYVLFFINSVGLIVLSGMLTYLFYAFVPNDQVNLPALIVNRTLLLLIPTIFEIFIKYDQIQEQLNYIKAQKQVLQLNQQINPHLLFNAFSQLQKHIIQKTNDAEMLIEQLAALTRYSLRIANQIFVDLEEEKNYLQSYIALETNRLGGRISIDFNVQTHSWQHKLPAMFLIVLLENAFKYSPIHGKIEMNIVLENEDLFVQIKNEKSKTEHRKSTGIGLANIKERLALLYPKKHSLHIENAAGHFEVNLVLLK